ncbi:hypothetical protein BpHYR1_029949 [Brachionus plicatilis]|uniref:Uncharacterized protein n=1 Tax=Brachionus plicatilis TaxID=10195 RepID=A0A3M7QCX3_BRAPC|nr:hypothetical protein BpHYR1_029949 [Brachionus plicatilis]
MENLFFYRCISMGLVWMVSNACVLTIWIIYSKNFNNIFIKSSKYDTNKTGQMTSLGSIIFRAFLILNNYRKEILNSKFYYSNLRKNRELRIYLKFLIKKKEFSIKLNICDLNAHKSLWFSKKANKKDVQIVKGAFSIKVKTLT